ncbi:MAG: hypothetical protein O7F12_16455 [Nitrospirae bacterium]|nr:hypothetical protein [Nitrospirota bacterium]
MIIGNGRHHAIVSLAERQSRLGFLAKVARKNAGLVTQVIIGLLNPLSLPLYTLPG